MIPFSEMIEYLENSKVMHFENQFLVCRDFRKSLGIYKDVVFGAIKSGVDPRKDLICKKYKKEVEHFYEEIKKIEL